MMLPMVRERWFAIMAVDFGVLSVALTAARSLTGGSGFVIDRELRKVVAAAYPQPIASGCPSGKDGKGAGSKGRSRASEGVP